MLALLGHACGVRRAAARAMLAAGWSARAAHRRARASSSSDRWRTAGGARWAASLSRADVAAASIAPPAAASAPASALHRCGRPRHRHVEMPCVIPSQHESLRDVPHGSRSSCRRSCCGPTVASRLRRAARLAARTEVARVEVGPRVAAGLRARAADPRAASARARCIPLASQREHRRRVAMRTATERLRRRAASRVRRRCRGTAARSAPPTGRCRSPRGTSPGR